MPIPILNLFEIMLFLVLLLVILLLLVIVLSQARAPDADVPDAVPDADVPDAVPAPAPAARRSRHAARRSRHARAPARPRRSGNIPQPDESYFDFLMGLPDRVFIKIKNTIWSMGLPIDIFRMLVEDSVEQIHNLFPNVDWVKFREFISHEFQNSPQLVHEMNNKIGELIVYQNVQKDEVVLPKPRPRINDRLYDQLRANNNNFSEELKKCHVCNPGFLFLCLYVPLANLVSMFPNGDWMRLSEYFHSDNHELFQSMSETLHKKISGKLKMLSDEY